MIETQRKRVRLNAPPAVEKKQLV